MVADEDEDEDEDDDEDANEDEDGDGDGIVRVMEARKSRDPQRYAYSKSTYLLASLSESNLATGAQGLATISGGLFSASCSPRHTSGQRPTTVVDPVQSPSFQPLASCGSLRECHL